MSCLLWFRTAHCVRFTSLRDMSLHRNRHRGHCPLGLFALRANRPFMRGPRA